MQIRRPSLIGDVLPNRSDFRVAVAHFQVSLILYRDTVTRSPLDTSVKTWKPDHVQTETP